MKLLTLIAAWFLFSMHCVLAQQGTPSPHNDTQLICVPFGNCEPCPEDALSEPACQPFGNRRLVHCVPAPAEPHPSAGTPIGGTSNHQGEIPAWESCGRIVEKERGDFYEFVACNLVIAILAVLTVFVRSKRLKAMQARQLAARIGLVRPTPGGWVEG